MATIVTAAASVLEAISTISPDGVGWGIEAWIESKGHCCYCSV
jgi:hypothetical protein